MKELFRKYINKLNRCSRALSYISTYHSDAEAKIREYTLREQLYIEMCNDLLKAVNPYDFIGADRFTTTFLGREITCRKWTRVSDALADIMPPIEDPYAE